MSIPSTSSKGLLPSVIMIVYHTIILLDSLVDSIHGGPGHDGMLLLEQQHQLFASEGAIRFPIEPVTEAWTEKVCY